MTDFSYSHYAIARCHNYFFHSRLTSLDFLSPRRATNGECRKCLSDVHSTNSNRATKTLSMWAGDTREFVQPVTAMISANVVPLARIISVKTSWFDFNRTHHFLELGRMVRRSTFNQDGESSILLAGAMRPVRPMDQDRTLRTFRFGAHRDDVAGICRWTTRLYCPNDAIRGRDWFADGLCGARGLRAESPVPGQ